MKSYLRQSDWPTHLAAIAFLLLLIAPVTREGAAPAVIGAGAVLALAAAAGIWSRYRSTVR